MSVQTITLTQFLRRCKNIRKIATYDENISLKQFRNNFKQHYSYWGPEFIYSAQIKKIIQQPSDRVAIGYDRNGKYYQERYIVVPTNSNDPNIAKQINCCPICLGKSSKPCRQLPVIDVKDIVFHPQTIEEYMAEHNLN